MNALLELLRSVGPKLTTVSEIFFWLHPRPLALLAVFAVAYYRFPVRRFQNGILLCLGAVFALALSKLFFLQIFSFAAVEALLAIAIQRASSRRLKLALFTVSTVLNLIVLFFLLSIDLQLWVQGVLAGHGIPGWPAVPKADFFIGSISVYSMFTLTSDAYTGRFKESPGFWRSMIFSTVFYRFVGLPVQRARDVLANLASSRRFDRAVVECGCWLVLQGCVKMLLANWMTLAYLQIGKGTLSGGPLLGVYWLLAIRSWTSISGTIDIASGLAHIFGLPMAANFDAPFLATNIADFWRRWHSGFTNWLGEEIFSRVAFALRRWGSLGLGVACFATFAGSALGHSLDAAAVFWGCAWGLLFWTYFENRHRIARFSKKRGNPFWIKFAGWFFTAHFIVITWGVLPNEGRTGSYQQLLDLFRFAGSSSSVGPLLDSRLLFAMVGAIVLHTIPHGHGGDQWLQRLRPAGKALAIASSLVLIAVYA